MKYLLLVIRLVRYFFIFSYALVVANLQVAKAVLSPGFRFKSAAVRYQSKIKTPTELIFLTNSITLTPGTLVMDADLKTGVILVHVFSGESTEQIKKDLNKFPEEEVIRTLRGKMSHD